MSPRAYQLGKREAGTAASEERIVAAARRLLAADGYPGFTVDNVAREADVARMTVYHRFGSKPGLLEAVFDSLASHRGAPQLVEAIRAADPLAGLAAFVRLLGGFWNADRQIVKRLQGLTAIDPDFEQIWRAREDLRRQGLEQLARRIAAVRGRPAGARLKRSVDLLYALVSFETFDAAAGPHQPLSAVAPDLIRLARTALDIVD
ncbi:MAG TPA: TetR/AcrR family transcriptional regulator [Candidatus Dormibacteraeota bacterium]